MNPPRSSTKQTRQKNVSATTKKYQVTLDAGSPIPNSLNDWNPTELSSIEIGQLQPVFFFSSSSFFFLPPFSKGNIQNDFFYAEGGCFMNEAHEKIGSIYAQQKKRQKKKEDRTHKEYCCEV
jgi:hypothetical protein